MQEARTVLKRGCRRGVCMMNDDEIGLLPSRAPCQPCRRVGGLKQNAVSQNSIAIIRFKATSRWSDGVPPARGPFRWKGAQGQSIVAGVAVGCKVEEGGPTT